MENRFSPPSQTCVFALSSQRWPDEQLITISLCFQRLLAGVVPSPNRCAAVSVTALGRTLELILRDDAG